MLLILFMFLNENTKYIVKKFSAAGCHVNIDRNEDAQATLPSAAKVLERDTEEARTGLVEIISELRKAVRFEFHSHLLSVKVFLFNPQCRIRFFFIV